MIDLSDGLAGDLGRLLLASGVGAALDAAEVARGAGLREAAAALGEDALDLALVGGEDYELLFSAPDAEMRAAAGEILANLGVAVRRIGTIGADRGVTVLREGGETRSLDARSFDHFAS